MLIFSLETKVWRLYINLKIPVGLESKLPYNKSHKRRQINSVEYERSHDARTFWIRLDLFGTYMHEILRMFSKLIKFTVFADGEQNEGLIKVFKCPEPTLMR